MVDRSLQIRWAKAQIIEEYRRASPEEKLLIRGHIRQASRLFNDLQSGITLGQAAAIKAKSGDPLALEFLLMSAEAD